MKNNTLAVSTLVSALLVGGVLGFVIAHRQIDRHFRNFPQKRIEQSFPEMFLSHLDATEKQKEELVDILNRYGVQFESMHERHYTEMDELRDSLDAEIKPFLTEKQIAILKEKRKEPPHPPRRQDGHDKGKMPPPPPHNKW